VGGGGGEYLANGALRGQLNSSQLIVHGATLSDRRAIYLKLFHRSMAGSE